MKVKDIMTRDPHVCAPTTDLATVAALMLDGDCGILPVVDNAKVAGVVTDRDLYIALATRNRRASEVTVSEVVQTPAITCGPEVDVYTALAIMKRHRVRRLPVEGPGGNVLGVISMNDLLLAAGAQKLVREAEVTDALRAICAHQHNHPTRLTAA